MDAPTALIVVLAGPTDPCRSTAATVIRSLISASSWARRRLR
jgi:hypothetical protein